MIQGAAEEVNICYGRFRILYVETTANNQSALSRKG